MQEAEEGIAWKTAFSSITCSEGWVSKSTQPESGFGQELEACPVVIILDGKVERIQESILALNDD